ncbi:MAG: hypothetical protein HYZ60_02145 [Methylocystis sp.]|nr:hypothetical protein [Methylocystis sp.]
MPGEADFLPSACRLDVIAKKNENFASARPHMSNQFFRPRERAQDEAIEESKPSHLKKFVAPQLEKKSHCREHERLTGEGDNNPQPNVSLRHQGEGRLQQRRHQRKGKQERHKRQKRREVGNAALQSGFEAGAAAVANERLHADLPMVPEPGFADEDSGEREPQTFKERAFGRFHSHGLSFLS